MTVTAADPLKGQEDLVSGSCSGRGTPFMTQDPLLPTLDVWIIKEAAERARFDRP